MKTNYVRRRLRWLALTAFVAVSTLAHAADGGSMTSPVNQYLTPFVDASTLMRNMSKQLISVARSRAAQEMFVLPPSACSGMAVGTSRIMTLPDIRWGVKTGSSAFVSPRGKAEIRWPGRSPLVVLLNAIPPNSEKAFVFPRPEPRSLKVTFLSVDGATQTSSPAISDGTSNTIAVGEQAAPTGGSTSPPAIKDGTSNTIMTSETSQAPKGTYCVSNVFVQDPPVEVLVTVPGQPANVFTATF